MSAPSLRSIYDLHPEANTVEAVLARLNAYERKPEGKPLTDRAILTKAKAVRLAASASEPYDLVDFHDGALFILYGAAVAWLADLTPKGYEDALRDEVLTGWFVEQDPSEDEDEFMSTPCIDCMAFDLEDVESGLSDCSRGGVLLLSPYMA